MKICGYTSSVDRVTREEWSGMLDAFQDANIYQTWSYGAVRWGETNLSHLVLKRGAEPLAAAQLRIVHPWNQRVGVAYLRWGPLCHLKGSDLQPEVIWNMATALYEEYVHKRGLYLRILPNALTETLRAREFQAAFWQFESEEFGHLDSTRTFVLDLEPSLDELRKKLDQKWRNQLNRAEKNGLKVIEGDGPDEFRMFVKIYGEMLARKQFNASIDIQAFGRIQEDLPKRHRMRVLICEHEGVPVAGVVGSAMGDSGIYLLGATSDKGLTSKGAYLLQWTMIRRFKESGIRYYDLAGINPQVNPGVYHFKKGLSGQDVLYMNPLVACDSILSKVLVKAASLARETLGSHWNLVLRRHQVPSDNR